MAKYQVKGAEQFRDRSNAAYPEATVQSCIVHLVRQSLNFCGWKNRKAVAKHLKQIYQATHDRINGAKNIHPSHPHGGALDKG